jgi:hypothetical protein
MGLGVSLWMWLDWRGCVGAMRRLQRCAGAVTAPTPFQPPPEGAVRAAWRQVPKAIWSCNFNAVGPRGRTARGGLTGRCALLASFSLCKNLWTWEGLWALGGLYPCFLFSGLRLQYAPLCWSWSLSGPDF